MTITPFNGSEALYQLAFMDVDAVRPPSDGAAWEPPR